MPNPQLYGDLRVHGAPTATKDATDAEGLVRRGQLDANGTYDRDRANHTGTQTAATIRDLPAVLDARIATLIGGAPAAFDTLKEIADELARDDVAAVALSSQLTALTNRVTAAENRLAAYLERTIGDGTATTFTITHTLGSARVRVEVLDLGNGSLTVYPIVTRPDSTRVVVDFAGATIPVNSHLVLIDAR